MCDTTFETHRRKEGGLISFTSVRRRNNQSVEKSNVMRGSWRRVEPFWFQLFANDVIVVGVREEPAGQLKFMLIAVDDGRPAACTDIERSVMHGSTETRGFDNRPRGDAWLSIWV